jgi:hypothetical protein
MTTSAGSTMTADSTAVGTGTTTTTNSESKEMLGNSLGAEV